LKTGRREYLDTLRPEVPFRFTPHSLAPIGDGSRILVGDSCGLWLLTLGSAERQKTP
jgi:hypothetical protein